MKKISIVLAAFNGGKFIREQLESLRVQTRPPDEVLVCDDASADGTPEIVADFIAANGLADWRLVRNERNLGFKLNFRNGLEQATGDLIFLCDQDDRWLPEKIRLVEAQFEAHPDLQVLAHGFDFMDGAAPRALPPPAAGTCNHGLIRQPSRPGELLPIDFPTILNKNVSMGCTLAFVRGIRDVFLACSRGEMSHDYEINLYGGARGGLCFYDVPLLQYRIHDANACGLYTLEAPYVSLAHQKLCTWRGYVAGLQTRIRALDTPGAIPAERRAELRYFQAFRKFVALREAAVARGSFAAFLKELPLYALRLRGSVDPRGLVLDALHAARLDGWVGRWLGRRAAPTAPPDAVSKPFCWTGDFPEPSPILKRILERELACAVVADGRRIPARWSPVRRQLAYLGRAGSILRRRRAYRGFFCVQQFIGLYACWIAAWLRLSLPPIFLQPLIYVPRRGLPGRLWRHLFATALGHPALKIAFCHSQSEIDTYRETFPAAAGKFRPLRFAVEPLSPPAAPAAPAYLFSAGTSCRDYATLFEAARKLPPACPPLRIACKPADVQGLVPPSNVVLHHDLWAQPFRDALAGAAVVVVPLRPLPVSAGQIVFLLAMSAARPIVATRTPVSVEFLDDACAWLVPPEDPDALAAAIRDAVEHPEKAGAKAAAARARFEAGHTPEAIFGQCASAIAAEMA